MTEADALILMHFQDARIFGWDIVLAINPRTGRYDGRTRRSKEASELMRDLVFNRPSFDVLLQALKDEEDVVELWPEAMRETVRFRIEHKVPRDHNEPTSDVFRASMRDHQGEDWPEWLHDHGKGAAVEDHPPFPPRSERYRDLDAKAAARQCPMTSMNDNCPAPGGHAA